MKVEDIPVSTEVVSSASHVVLAAALASIFGDLPITHVTPISGTTNSGRLLLARSHVDAVMLTGMMDGTQAAAEFIELAATEARYPKQPGSAFVKGWQVRKAVYGGKPAAVVWAVWLPKD